MYNLDQYEMDETPIIRNKTTGKIVRQVPNGYHGSLCVGLHGDGKNNMLPLNRLVMCTLGDMPVDPTTMRVMHVNGNLGDVSLSNLKWVLMRKGVKRPRFGKRVVTCPAISTRKRIKVVARHQNGHEIVFPSHQDLALEFEIPHNKLSGYIRDGTTTADGWTFSLPVIQPLDGEIFKPCTPKIQISNLGRVLRRVTEQTQWYLSNPDEKNRVKVDGKLRPLDAVVSELFSK